MMPARSHTRLSNRAPSGQDALHNSWPGYPRVRRESSKRNHRSLRTPTQPYCRTSVRSFLTLHFSQFYGSKDWEYLNLQMEWCSSIHASSWNGERSHFSLKKCIFLSIKKHSGLSTMLMSVHAIKRRSQRPHSNTKTPNSHQKNLFDR